MQITRLNGAGAPWKKMKIKAIIFDLDGVLTDTAEYHYQAWKSLCKKLGLKFDRQINEQLKGVSRQQSFEILLRENNQSGLFSKADMERLIVEKNEKYVELLQMLTPSDVLAGIPEFLQEARRHRLKLAVASASRNAAFVLKKLELQSYFDYVADAGAMKRSKPDPEIFLTCAKALSVEPEACVGIEDAQAGIEAIKAAGMYAVGIGVRVTSVEPDLSRRSTRELDFQSIMERIAF